jgi:hypothetical protein
MWSRGSFLSLVAWIAIRIDFLTKFCPKNSSQVLALRELRIASSL